LRQQGATRRKLGVSPKIVRCRWTRDQPGALWVGDFEHGPPVMHQGRSVKTHLSAWIDCHSRYIVEARYYVRENLDILVDSLLRAWGNHGASRELYVDNAKIYHAKALQLACTQLNIRLLHRPPRDPAAGGLIERFFQTCQGQFEAEVRAGQILTLDDLNRVLAAWLQVAYHQDVNRETGETPHARYHQEPRLLRQVDLGTVLGFFQREVLRTVDKDFADVRLENLFFAVDPALRGDVVVVRYDPFAPLAEVQLYTPTGAYVGRGRRYQREKGSHPQPSPASPAGPVVPHYLDALRAEYAAQQEQRRSLGIDYHSARQRNVWSLSSFARVFARLLGRQGGMSGLTAQEMDLLAAFHARHDRVTESLLRQAFEQAAAATLPEVLFQLQSLFPERND
jgi:putative transposase